MITLLIDGVEYTQPTMADAVNLAQYHNRLGAAEIVIVDVYGNRSYYLGN
jgi:hypothetical protein